MSLINLLAVEANIVSNSTLHLLELLTKILKSNEENLHLIKLSVVDLLLLATKLIDHFFTLFNLMNGLTYLTYFILELNILYYKNFINRRKYWKFVDRSECFDRVCNIFSHSFGVFERGKESLQKYSTTHSYRQIVRYFE